MMPEMTAKERVNCAMELKQPDRVPVFPVITYMHASRVLKKSILEIELNPSLVYDSLVAAWREYGFDGFEVPLGRPRGWNDSLAVVEKAGSRYWVDTRNGKEVARLQEDDMPVYAEEPLIRDESDLEKLVIPKASDYFDGGQLDGLMSILETVGENAFVAAHCAGQTMNSLVQLRGANAALIDLVDNPQLVHAVMQRTTDKTIELGKALAEAGADCLYIGDAWCNSGIISPSQFEEFCVPQYRRFTQALHKHGVKIYIHICGNSSPILEKMASTGVDAIEPLDPLGGVRLEDAKARVGRAVCLKGGINTLTLLYGSTAQVREEVAAGIAKAAANGGYIFGTGDDIPRDAPIENVKAMVEAVHEFGRYL